MVATCSPSASLGELSGLANDDVHSLIVANLFNSRVGEPIEWRRRRRRRGAIQGTECADAPLCWIHFDCNYDVADQHHDGAMKTSERVILGAAFEGKT